MKVAQAQQELEERTSALAAKEAQLQKEAVRQDAARADLDAGTAPNLTTNLSAGLQFAAEYAGQQTSPSAGMDCKESDTGRFFVRSCITAHASHAGD